MPLQLTSDRAQSAWERYEPGDDTPWNLARVVHLHRRAGFAATRAELERDLQDGPHAAIDRLLHGQARLAPSENFDALSATIGDAATASGNIDRLKAWWIFRLIASP